MRKMVDPRETTNKHDRFSGCFAPSHSRTFFSLQKKKCLSLSAVPWCSRPDDPEFDHELESCLIMLSSSDKLTQAFFSLQTKKQNKKKMKIQRPLFVVQAQRFISDPEIKQTLRVQSQGRRLLVGGPSLADRRCSSLKLRIFVFVFSFFSRHYFRSPPLVTRPRHASQPPLCDARRHLLCRQRPGRHPSSLWFVFFLFSTFCFGFSQIDDKNSDGPD